MSDFSDAMYLLPIRSYSLEHVDELTAYLRTLPLPVTIVDGSPPHIFDEHARRWSSFAMHLRPNPAIDGANGKVRGVLTGLACGDAERIVIADDDIRYDDASLRAVLSALDDGDVVRPQNYFVTHRWHTVLDTSRSLIARISGGDWPGTLAVRRSALPNGYDADVLFENLELVRTVAAGGGRERVARDIYVERRPPTTRHFFSQRVRHAYDEFARPLRLAIALAVLPLVAFALARRAFGALAISAAAVAVAAESGRRGWNGREYFPPAASAAAPLWVLERGFCAWVALALRLLRGGVPYAGALVHTAAHSVKTLRSRVA